MKDRVFSERHEKALRSKRIKLSLRLEFRRSLLRLFQSYSGWNDWLGEYEICEAVAKAILDRRGWQALQYWNGAGMVSVNHFSEFIEKGTPHHVIDAIELFVDELELDKIAKFTSDLNKLFEIHHINLRYFNGEFYIIDSDFLESEVLSQAQQLLDSNTYSGALEEFLNARSAFMEKDYKQCILLANHALESTMKAILGKDANTGELIKKICRDGYAPSYYEGFLDHFREFLNIVVKTRNNEAGHGQGKDVADVPASLAELTLHLSASLIVFLIKCHLEKNPPVEIAPQDIIDEDVPF